MSRVSPPGSSGVRTALSRRAAGLPGYPLADAPEILERLRSEGRTVLDLGAGDPGLPVPEVAVRTLRESAADPGMRGYAFQRGLPELREAIADFMVERYGRRPDPRREVLPLIGSKEGIAHLPFAVLDPGDTALVPDPGYAPYAGGCLLAGARVERALLSPDAGFRVDPKRVEAAPGRLRLVFLNYPNNPTGATVEREYLEEMARACRRRDAVLALDNPYAEIYFDGRHPPGLLGLEEGTGAGIEFHSFSKSFGMTGWRLGWVCGRPEVLEALARVKSYFDTGAWLAVQAAGAALLRGAGPILAERRRRLEARRDAAVAALRAEGFEVDPPAAGLYLWLRTPGGRSSEAFARRALEREALLVLPGSAMGRAGEGWFRVALTLPPEAWPEAGRRLAAAGSAR